LISYSVVSILFAAILVSSACDAAPEAKANSKVNVPPGATLLRGAGATFPSVLYKNWFASYQKTHPQTVISYDAVGSGEGIRRFVGRNVAAEETIDFGASDAAMSDEQIAAAPAGVHLLPMTAGSVALAYNLPNLSGDLKLSRVTLA